MSISSHQRCHLCIYTPKRSTATNVVLPQIRFVVASSFTEALQMPSRHSTDVIILGAMFIKALTHLGTFHCRSSNRDETW